MFLILLCPLMALKLVETFPQNKEHLHTYCVVGLYILTLLVDGYKFDEHTWSNIHFSQKVKIKALWGSGNRQAAVATSLHWPKDTMLCSGAGLDLCNPYNSVIL